MMELAPSNCPSFFHCHILAFKVLYFLDQYLISIHLKQASHVTSENETICAE
jgi:hypothetical protein